MEALGTVLWQPVHDSGQGICRRLVLLHPLESTELGRGLLSVGSRGGNHEVLVVKPAELKEDPVPELQELHGGVVSPAGLLALLPVPLHESIDTSSEVCGLSLGAALERGIPGALELSKKR